LPAVLDMRREDGAIEVLQVARQPVATAADCAVVALHGLQREPVVANEAKLLVREDTGMSDVKGGTKWYVARR